MSAWRNKTHETIRTGPPRGMALLVRGNADAVPNGVILSCRVKFSAALTNLQQVKERTAWTLVAITAATIYGITRARLSG